MRRSSPGRPCDVCGRQWPADAVWCGACGASLVEVAAPPPPGSQGTDGTTGRRGQMAALVTVAVLVAAAVATTVAVSGPSDRAAAVPGQVGVPDADELAAPDAREVGQRARARVAAQCRRGDAQVQCVQWARPVQPHDVLRGGGPETPGDAPVDLVTTAVTSVGVFLTIVDGDTGEEVRGWGLPNPPESVEVAAPRVLVHYDRWSELRSLADGVVRWRTDDDGLVHGDVIAGSLAYVGHSGADGRWIIARHLDDGREAWRWPLDDRFGPRDPVFVTRVAGGHVLVHGTGAPRIAVLDPRDGLLVWQRLLPGRTALEVRPGRVLVVLADDDGPAEGPPVPGGPVGTVQAIDTSDGTVQWARTFPDADLSLGTMPGRVLVGTSSRLTSLDLDTGDVSWRVGTGSRERPATVPSLHGETGASPPTRNLVVTVDDANGVLRARAASDGTEVWGTPLPPPPGSFATVVGDHVMVDRPAGVDFVDLATGDELVDVAGRLIPFPSDTPLVRSPAGTVARIVLPPHGAERDHP